MAELGDLREHLERFRAVTLQSLDLLTDDDMRWRSGSVSSSGTEGR
jgi:hypothetical protein